MRLRFACLIFALVAAACRTYTVTYTNDGGPCATPRTVCSGTCVDTTTDRNNCGQCGVMCAANQLCLAGADGGSTCQSCPSNSDSVCGTGGGSFCVDTTTDDNNCGMCSHACAHGEHCMASSCVCSLTQCGTDCVDLQTDVAHCGACTTPCGSPGSNEIELCTGGHCSQQCISPFADCDGIPTNGCEANLLTDSKNCGACGRACGNGGMCATGMCPVTTYATSSNLTGLAVDSSFVYWADDATSGGAIYKEPIGGGMTDGGSSAQVVYSVADAAFVAVDATYLLWMQSGTAVESRLLMGGSVTQIAAFTGGVGMLLAGGFAYYSTTDGKNWRVPEDGSAMPTLLSSTGAARAAAVDNTNIYGVINGDIDSLPITAMNATPTPFATKQSALGIAIDSSNVYWTTANGTLVAAPKSNPSTAAPIVSGQTNPNPIATDGASVYWADTDGSIHRAPINGSSTLTLATNQGTPVMIVVDASNVYWSGPTLVASTTK